MTLAGLPLRREVALVFMKESGFHTSIALLWTSERGGERALREGPAQPGQNETLIASTVLEGASLVSSR